MKKAQQLRELCKRIKEKYNLDSVTAVSSKSQYKKVNRKHDPRITLFKMRYRLKGDDAVQLCPISWHVIGQVKWDTEVDGEMIPNPDLDDDLMIVLIVKTCGEVLASHPDVKAVLMHVLSPMAQNAEMRAADGN